MSKKKSTTNDYDVPETMKAWVLGDPHEMKLVEKTVPEPGSSEVLVKIGAIAVCHTDIEVLHHGDGDLIFVVKKCVADVGVRKCSSC